MRIEKIRLKYSDYSVFGNLFWIHWYVFQLSEFPASWQTEPFVCLYTHYFSQDIYNVPSSSSTPSPSPLWGPVYTGAFSVETMLFCCFWKEWSPGFPFCLGPQLERSPCLARRRTSRSLCPDQPAESFPWLKLRWSSGCRPWRKPSPLLLLVFFCYKLHPTCTSLFLCSVHCFGCLTPDVMIPNHFLYVKMLLATNLTPV